MGREVTVAEAKALDQLARLPTDLLHLEDIAPRLFIGGRSAVFGYAYLFLVRGTVSLRGSPSILQRWFSATSVEHGPGPRALETTGSTLYRALVSFKKRNAILYYPNKPGHCAQLNAHV